MNTVDKDDYDVLLVGRYFCDLVFSRLPEFPRLGHEVYSREFHLVPGGVYTPAVTLTRLGLRTAWPCKFGSDPFSLYVKEQAEKSGIDNTFFDQLDKPSLQLTVAFSFEHERAFLSYIDSLPEIHYPEMIKQAKPGWVYITHLLVGEAQEKIVQASREVGAKVYMDCQAHNTNIEDPSTYKAIANVDVFSPNRAEAQALTGEDQIGRALEKLSKINSPIIIKDGVNGCLSSFDDEIFRVPGIQVDVVDTTGAGDNFNCGFIYGQIRGYSLEDSLRIGNICGGLSTQDFGGNSESITLDKIRSLIK